MESFWQSMKRVKHNNPVFVLVGNKCDQTSAREVSKEEGASLARLFGCEFLETSAKTGYNVDFLFMNLVRSLRASRVIAELDMTNAHAKNRQKKLKCVIM